MIIILLFGSKGFIGSNIANTIVLNKKFKLITPTSALCDLTKLNSVKKYIEQKKPDIVINAAFDGVSTLKPFSADYILKNTNMVINLLEACRDQKSIKKIIHFGSATEYGDSATPITENGGLAPKNVYGTAKAISSLSALQMCREYSLPLVILRPFYLYGPHDNKSVLYYLMSSLIKGNKFALTAGEQLRDYMYIRDFAKLVNKICENTKLLKNGEVYNVGTGTGITLQGMFNEIFKTFKKKPKFAVRDYSKNEYFSQVAGTKKIKNALGIKKFTPVTQGIFETMEWVKLYN